MSDKEIPEFYLWWKFWHRNGFSKAMHCESIVVVEDEGRLGAAMHLYRIDKCAYIIFSFLVRNPYCDRDFSSQAVDFLLMNLGNVSKTLGYNTFLVSTEDELAKARLCTYSSVRYSMA